MFTPFKKRNPKYNRNKHKATNSPTFTSLDIFISFMIGIATRQTNYFWSSIAFLTSICSSPWKATTMQSGNFCFTCACSFLASA